VAFDARHSRFAQLHAQTGFRQVVADDGTTDTDELTAASVAFIRNLRNVIDPLHANTLDDSVTACQTPNDTPPTNPATGNNGCYSTNVQARYTHLQADPAVSSFNSCTQGSGYGADFRVLLIEHNRTALDDDCADGFCWSRVAEALRRTWGCVDGSAACAIGSAQPKYADRVCP
jgi:hypothetical protein